MKTVKVIVNVSVEIFSVFAVNGIDFLKGMTVLVVSLSESSLSRKIDSGTVNTLVRVQSL